MRGERRAGPEPSEELPSSHRRSQWLANVDTVPLLGFTELLPRRPRRVLVAGTSGSGKSTLAARIADVLTVPHVEIDALFHGPDWTPRPSFEQDVHASAPSLPG